MTKVVGGMTISLDGFINDRSGSVSLLYPDMAGMQDSEVMQESMKATGAVVMGRKSYDMGNDDFTGYEFQTPIFVLTHQAPEKVANGENENLKFHFVTDGIESAVAKAKAAARGKDVTVIGGASTIQQLIKAGLLDELHIDLAPVLLGEGTRLFEPLGIEPIHLEQLQVVEYRGVTHLEFRVRKHH